MSYQALYRVWRPQRFADLVGQQLVVKTLQNAIKTNQTSHAYLFCGPRGTGKTSAAKIFAKAINCHHQQDGEPCNQCEICQAITQGKLGDVIEIDAASNNGVEEIRDVRDKAKYAPTVADYKVYIIDEVHMLSKGAFNALLKTLEEPPQNVIFILATTEPQKIPATIISRTQRFDFKRIEPHVILKRLEYILNEKQVSYEDDAIKIIAKAAEGGMRDALSILDQVISYGDGKTVSQANAELVTGVAKQQQLMQYLAQVFAHDTTSALTSVEKLLSEGKDASRIIEGAINYCRDLLLYQQNPKLVEASELGQISDEFKQLAQSVDAMQLTDAITTLNHQQENMRFSTHPSIYLEVVTVLLAQEKPNVTPTAKSEVVQITQAPITPEETKLREQIFQLTQKVNQLEKQFSAAKALPEKSAAQPVKQAPKQEYSLKFNQINEILAAANRSSLVKLKEVWDDALAMLNVRQKAIFHFSQPVAASDAGVVIAMQYPFLCQKAMDDQNLQMTMKNNLNRLIGNPYALQFVASKDWQKLRQNFIANRKQNPSASSSEGAIKSGEQNTSAAVMPSQANLASEAAEASLATSEVAKSESDNEKISQTFSQPTNQPPAASLAATSDDIVEAAVKQFGSEVVNVSDD